MSGFTASGQHVFGTHIAGRRQDVRRRPFRLERELYEPRAVPQEEELDAPLVPPPVYPTGETHGLPHPIPIDPSAGHVTVAGRAGDPQKGFPIERPFHSAPATVVQSASLSPGSPGLNALAISPSSIDTRSIYPRQARWSLRSRPRSSHLPTARVRATRPGALHPARRTPKPLPGPRTRPVGRAREPTQHEVQGSVGQLVQPGHGRPQHDIRHVHGRGHENQRRPNGHRPPGARQSPQAPASRDSSGTLIRSSVNRAESVRGGPGERVLVAGLRRRKGLEDARLARLRFRGR